MEHTRLKLLPALTITLVMMCTMVAITADSDESEAATSASGTATVGEYYSRSFSLSTSYNEFNSLTYWGEGMTVSSGKGLTADISGSISGLTTKATISVTGTPTSTGSVTFKGYVEVDAENEAGDIETFKPVFSVTITIEAGSTPVSSVSISGSTSGTVGGSITLTATTSPTTADDRHVTWSITSGSSYASISSTSNTTTGGRCVLSLDAAGTVTVKATAADGSGAYATKAITISKPSYTCYLYYDANGGTGEPSDQSYTGTSTSNHSFTISTTKPTRSGYTFLGWATTAGATTASYQPGGTISVGYNSSKTLYAVWEQTKYSHTLSYDANGGTGAPSSSTVSNTSSTYSMTVSSTEPTRSGYIFMGWAKTSTATSAAYHGGDTVSVGSNATVTLYAVWQVAAIDITTTQGDVTITSGQQLSLSLSTNVSGCTFSVSGATWLSVSGNTVSGASTTPGTYDVTITAGKTGYTSDTLSFTVTVVSPLGFESNPSNGVTAYVLA